MDAISFTWYCFLRLACQFDNTQYRRLDKKQAYWWAHNHSVYLCFVLNIFLFKPNVDLAISVVRDAKDAQILQNLLYKPMTHLTAQRLRELRLATRRFVDSSKLTLAQRFSNTESYFESITAILDAPSEQVRMCFTILLRLECPC